MSDPRESPPVTLDEVRRLAHATGAPWIECKRFLDSLSTSDRALYFHAVEAGDAPKDTFCDPRQIDPATRPLVQAALEEARRIVDEQRRAEMAATEHLPRDHVRVWLAHNVRGTCRRVWRVAKTLLRERHGIDWRTPAELNTFCHFD